MKLLLVLLLLIASLASAQEAGLRLTLTAGGTGETETARASGKTDTRKARLVALFVPAGQPVSPFFPAGPFTARFEGSIQSLLKEERTFMAELSGTMRMTINATEVLAGKGDGTKRIVGLPVKLVKGANQIVVEYEAPAQGDAFVRLLWSSPEFFPEPVPPTVFESGPVTAALYVATQFREGRLLFAQRRCTACHEGGDLLPPHGEGMPELQQDAPIFSDFGARFKEAWLASWINNPHAIRPGSLMPRLFAGAGDGIDQRAADLAAFLAALGTPPTETALPDDLVPQGGALFANLGCIACHTTPEFDGQDEFKRVPLGHVKAKWYPAALQEYLKDPQKLYQWTRMPNFHLSDEEAAKLTAFLLAGNQKEFAAEPKGDAAKGGQIVASAGCLNCHAGLPPTTAPKLADLIKQKRETPETMEAQWERGCLAVDSKARGAAPDFGWTKAQQRALVTFALAGFPALKQDLPTEFARRQVANLRCTACHTRDAEASAWSQLDNDIAPLQALAPVEEGEGKPIAGALAPLATWLGEKLRPQWMADFIAGKNTTKVRPWIIARMPAFATYASALAPGLAHEHGFSEKEPPKPAAVPEKIGAGETLLGDTGGFNCVTCHGVGERKPTAVFEAPGINLALSAERLRYEYYRRWVLFPQRIDPETKMPKFADDQGKTPLTDFFKGDAHQQYDAIWAYLKSM